MGLVAFFLLCIIAGLIFAVLSVIFSTAFGGSGLPFSGDGADADIGDVSGADVSFSPFSTTVLATFVTAFGAGGVVGLEGLHWSPLASVALGIGSGLAIGGMVYFVLNAVYKRTQGSSEPGTEELIGLSAEVITAIPKEGLGEIAYVVRGSRSTSSARSADGTAIIRGTTVTIQDISGSSLLVKPLSTNTEPVEE